MKKRIRPLFLAGLCLAAVADVDLRGVWHATGNGIDAEITSSCPTRSRI